MGHVCLPICRCLLLCSHFVYISASDCGCAKLFLELPLLILFRVIQLPWRGKEINGCCFDHNVMSLDEYLVSQKSLPYIVHFSGYVMNNYVVLVAISILQVHLMCVQISFGSYR